ncbi:MAG: hypothetical protein U1F68_21425 [Gammaproteobacteria bacterium]
MILKAGVYYFAIVFGAGFVLGFIRVLWVVPRLGARTAELLEALPMLIVIFLAARWITGRFAAQPGAPPWLAVGGIGLICLLIAEFTVILWLRGLTLKEYFANRDPVAGAVYLALLGVFALMPLLVARR